MTLDDDSFSARLMTLFGLAAPIAMIGMLLGLNLININVSAALTLKAPFFLTAIYYWALFAPPLAPRWLAFTGGLLIDIFTLAPLGLNALLLTAVQKLTISQRPLIASQPFSIIWGILILIYAFTLLITALFSVGFIAPTLITTNGMLSFLMNCLLMPVIYAAVHLSHILMLTPIPSPLDRRRRNIILKRNGLIRRFNKIRGA